VSIKDHLIYVLLLAMGLLWIGNVAADGKVVNELFSDVPTLTDLSIAAALSEQEQQDRQDPTIVRSRYVIVNFEKLAGKHLPQGVKTIVLNLFADLSLTAAKKRTERRSPAEYTWFGQIQGAKYSQVILVVKDGSMAGNIRRDGKLYQVRAVGQGVHAIYEIPPEAPPVPVDSGPAEVQEDAGSNTLMEESDGETVIDVMVVYSDDVADAVADIDSLIQLAIDETNESYSNSSVNQRLRLVHRAQVDYVETGDSSTDLSRLQDSSDGFIDEIHTLRDTYGADCVSFWVESMGACGRGYRMISISSAFAAWAFTVVRRSCATGYYSFGHELGHNMSAHHDCYVDTTDQPYPYIHGYVNTADRWRTIMAYDEECDDAGFDCTRIPYWSNPSVSYNGDPMGEEDGGCDSNNARTLDNTASTIAAFRTVTTPTNPDLVVINPSVSDSTLTPGQSFTIYATVKNQGFARQIQLFLLVIRSWGRMLFQRSRRTVPRLKISPPQRRATGPTG
jgi:hypothetical protein